MSPDNRRVDVNSTPEEITAVALGKLIAENLAEEDLGIRIDWPPSFNPQTLLKEISESSQRRIGLGIIGMDSIDVGSLDSEYEDTNLRLTSRVSDAVKWRNGSPTGHTWNGGTEPERIVLIVEGSEHPKINSMHRLSKISRGDIARYVTQVVSNHPNFRNNPAASQVWKTVGTEFSEHFDLESLAAYAASTLREQQQASLDALGNNLHHLGLLPDPDMDRADDIPDRLAENRKMASRCRHLSQTDRKRLSRAIRENGDLQGVIRHIREFQRTGDSESLASISFEEVKEAFSTKATRGGGGGGRTTRTTESSSSGALTTLFEEGVDGLEDLSDRIRDGVEDALETEENSARVERTEDSVVEVELDIDLRNFIRYFCREETFGGTVQEGSIDRAVEDFRSKTHETRNPFQPDSIFGRIQEFADQEDEFSDLFAGMAEYKEKREGLIPHVESLLFAPLQTLLGDGEIRKAANEYLDAYLEFQKTLDRNHSELQKKSPSGAHQALATFLSLDVVIFDSPDAEQAAILLPLHPLHLWKYVDLANHVVEEYEQLDEESREFLVESVEEQPHVLRSIVLGESRDATKVQSNYLIQTTERSGLPIYEDPDRASPGNNRRIWSHLIDKLITTYPPAARNLRITVVDPIEPSHLLKEITNFADEGKIGGAHIRFVHLNQDGHEPILSEASDSEREGIIERFGNSGQGESFGAYSYEVTYPDEYFDILERDSQHLVLVNDHTEILVQEFERDKQRNIHPLYVPKEFKYDALQNEITMVPTKEGTLFSEHQNLLNQFNNQRPTVHNSEVHSISTDWSFVEKSMGDSLWVVLSIPSSNTDPFWRENIISRERRGNRDYAIYSKRLDEFREALAESIGAHRLAPDDANLEEVITEIVESTRTGLLRMVVQDDGYESPHTRGILGTIIASRWIEETGERPLLIFSIDDPVTRKWLNLSNEGRRADILSIRPDDNGGLVVTVHEVKSRKEPGEAVQVTDDDPPEITGEAADQVMGSVRTLRRLCGSGGDVTAPPRREAFREQLYYQLIEQDNTGGKKDWVQRINNAVREDGEIEVRGEILSVELSEEKEDPETIDGITADAESLRITRLPRGVVKRLLLSEAPSVEEPETNESDTRGEMPQPEPADPTETEPDEDQDPGQTDATSREEIAREYAEQAEDLKRVLTEFGTDVREVDQNRIDVGPNVVRFKVRLAPGERQRSIAQRSEDIAREMALLKEPLIPRLPGTPFVAVDVPREDPEVVEFEDYRDQLAESESGVLGSLPFIAGIEPSGDVSQYDLKDGPHMLVSGTTGSGKTVFLYNILASLLDGPGTDAFDIALIDPKLTNFVVCQDLPNLVENEVITDAESANELFDWIVNSEIPRRKELLEENACIDIHHYNREGGNLKPIVVMVDEYADLLDQAGSAADELETNVRRIAQIARSVGIHLVIATQRPSHEIIDTDLRANLDMRAAFRVPKASDSQVILGESGAEELSGNGDMLFKYQDEKKRLQGLLIEPEYLRGFVESS